MGWRIVLSGGKGRRGADRAVSEKKIWGMAPNLRYVAQAAETEMGMART